MSDSSYTPEDSAGDHHAPAAATSVVPDAIEGADVAGCAVRLDELVTTCVSFLQSQLARVDEAYAELEKLQSSVGETGPDQEDLDEKQAAWERKQAEEAHRINEQLDYLTQAWSLLEDEQRRQITEGKTVAAPGLAQQPGSGHTGPAAAAPLDLIESPNDLSSSSAEIQFQKLKREIRQHARRNR